MKQNCWEILKCNRGPGSSKVSELGVCPAATEQKADGINDGENAGRVCWAIAGTYCGGKIQGEFAEKIVTCLTCEVFKKIQEEEREKFSLMLPGQKYQPAKR